MKRIYSQAHLAQILDHCEDECLQKVHIFLEEAGDLTLEELMANHPEGLPPESANDLFSQLVTAVAKLHELKICHRDLKPDNVILRQDESRPSGYYLTVVDFNVAVDTHESESIRGATGVKHWSAPETRAASVYSSKCDSYSLGCLLLFMLTAESPDSDQAMQMLAKCDRKS